MNKTIFEKCHALKFKRFGRKGYSLFSCLGKEVLVGVLSVSTLTYAKADSVTVTKVETQDSLSHEEVKLDEVIVTGSRAPLTALQSAKIVAVITKDEIHRAAATSVNDVLKLATSVDVRQRSSFGVQTDISINGGTFDQITILLNGTPISNPQTGHNATDFPISLSDIERIEILEGAVARVYGCNAFNGAINIVTRNNIIGNNLKVNVEGGSFGSFNSSSTYEGETANGWNILASGGYARSDGGTKNSDFEKTHLYTNIRPRISKYVDMNAQVGFSTQNYGANTFYSAKYDNQYENTSHLVTSATFGIHDIVKGLQVKSTLYYNLFTDHYQLMRGQSGAQAGENYHNLSIPGISIDASMAWPIGKTSVGIDIQKERILSTAYGDNLSEDDYKDISGSDRQYTRQGKRTNTNIFLEHNVLFGNFTLSAGILANRNTGLDNDYRFYPGIDISYRPSINWKLYVSWNKALRMPTYTDLYTSNTAQQGNIDLKPEKNSTFKLGTRYRRSGVEALISGFYSKGTNMIDWVYNTAESTKYNAMNIGKLDNMGFSTEVTLNIPSIMENDFFITRVKTGYSFIHQKHETDTQIFKSLYALEYLRHKFTMTIDHKIWRALTGSCNLRWQERMNGYQPYTKIDYKLLWKTPIYELYISADNITSHRYYDLAGVKQAGLWLMAGGKINIRL